MIKARITVTLKTGVLDPQGKVFDVEIEGEDRDGAKARLDTMCEKLLANTVIEDYSITLD